ncbi:hypothetical protein VCV18_012547 [Metarhizium anisopliae]|uniref:Uncharacterized protein n=1 Tax=Metarhizium rileyi (strain RCEF 4871) TaxID=1649241 RepID=A0A5C6G1I6_METRR|nr:hypothetical protein ED733_002317 [Metarhizium rileyi]
MSLQCELTAYLKDFLTQQWTRKQLPRGLEQGWKDYLEDPGANRYPGLKSFLAVRLGTIETASHYENRKPRGWLAKNLQQLSRDEVQEILSNLEQTVPHPTVAKVLDRIMATFPPGIQRPAHVEHPPILQGQSTTVTTPGNTSEARDRDSRDSPHASSDVDLATNIRYQQPALAVTAGQKFDNGCPKGLTMVFPPYICSAIRKIGSADGTKAAVTMIFPYQQDGSIHCLCSLSIIPSKLVIIAKEVMDVILDIEGGMLYVVSEKGWKVLPCPSMTLQGAPKGGIRFLGDRVSDAIETSPQRKDELNRSIIHTSSVTLNISHNPDDDGQLNLNFGLEAGLNIRALLYPDK